MNASTLMLYCGAFLLTSVVIGLAYVQMPFTPRKIERSVKAWLSPATLVGYLCVILSAFLSSIGQ